MEKANDCLDIKFSQWVKLRDQMVDRVLNDKMLDSEDKITIFYRALEIVMQKLKAENKLKDLKNQDLYHLQTCIALFLDID